MSWGREAGLLGSAILRTGEPTINEVKRSRGRTMKTACKRVAVCRFWSLEVGTELGARSKV